MVASIYRMLAIPDAPSARQPNEEPSESTALRRPHVSPQLLYRIHDHVQAVLDHDRSIEAGLEIAWRDLSEIRDRLIEALVQIRKALCIVRGWHPRCAQQLRDREHGDMGNLTPRILRCINMLNVHMGATGARSALRRVHHNAESHRNHIFGALTASQMGGGDGFPLTVFQPRALLTQGSPVRMYEDVCTLENMLEFRQYASLLDTAGYYVPKNWTWGMSIRDRVR